MENKRFLVTYKPIYTAENKKNWKTDKNKSPSIYDKKNYCFKCKTVLQKFSTFLTFIQYISLNHNKAYIK